MDTQLLVLATVQSQESLRMRTRRRRQQKHYFTKYIRFLPKFITITPARLICHMQGNFPGVKFLGITPKLRTSFLRPLPPVLQSSPVGETSGNYY